jgi:hypothetical protein
MPNWQNYAAKSTGQWSKSRMRGRVALRQKLADTAKEHGLTLDEVSGRGRKGKGSAAPKYRRNPQNTWNRPGPHAALVGCRYERQQGQEG